MSVRTLSLLTLAGLVSGCPGKPSTDDTADADTDTDTDTDSDADADSDSDTDTDSDTDSDTDADTDTDTDTDLTLTPTTGHVFVQVAAGGTHACALQDDGAVSCTHGLAAPSGTYAAISSGGGFSCGLLHDGTLTCWGEDAYGYGMVTPPTGTFTALESGVWQSCAARDDGAAVCWGREPAEEPGAYVATAVGYAYACGVDADGALTCWGSEAHYYTDRAAEAGLVGPWSSVQAGAWMCGADAGGTSCWWPYGDLRYDTSVSVYAGHRGICTLNAGRADCPEIDYDSTEERPLDAPDTVYDTLDVGYSIACGIEPDGAVSCWNLLEPRDWTE